MKHSHDFDVNEWPFDESVDTTVFSTKNVVREGFPILTVAHDRDGDWQFLCGTTDGPDDMSIVCFGCIYELHPFIARFKDLPRGWIAWRDDEDSPWQREELDGTTSSDLDQLYEDAMTALAEEEVDEAIELLDQMLSDAPDDPRTLEVQGDVARAQEDVQQAERHYRRLLDRAPDDHWRGIAHFSLGALQASVEKVDLVRDHSRQAIEYFQKAAEPSKAAEVYTALASFEQNQGDFQDAVAALETAHQLIQQENSAGDLDEQLATACQSLGIAYRMAGNLELAKQTLEEALSRFEELNDLRECADTLDALGVVEQIQGHYEMAEELHMQSLTINETIDDEDGMSVNYGNLTMLNIHRRDFDQAADWSRRGYEIDEAQGSDNGVAHYHLLMGEIECERDQLDQAERHLTECAKLYEGCGDAEDKLCANSKLAFLYRLRGDLDDASEINEQVLKAAEQMDFPDGIAATLDELAHVRLAQGRTEDAKALWERALAVYRQLGSARMITEVSGHLSKLG